MPKNVFWQSFSCASMIIWNWITNCSSWFTCQHLCSVLAHMTFLFILFLPLALKLPIKMPCPCHGTTVAHIIHRKHGWVYLMRCNEVHSKSSGHCDGCIINAFKKTLPEPLSFSITSGLNSWLSIQFLYGMFWKRKSKKCTILLFRFSFSHQLNQEIICLISVADSAVWSTRFQIYSLSKVRQDSTAMVAK